MWVLTSDPQRAHGVISGVANVQMEHISRPFKVDDAPVHVMLIGLAKRRLLVNINITLFPLQTVNFSEQPKATSNI